MEEDADRMMRALEGSDSNRLVAYRIILSLRGHVMSAELVDQLKRFNASLTFEVDSLRHVVESQRKALDALTRIPDILAGSSCGHVAAKPVESFQGVRCRVTDCNFSIPTNGKGWADVEIMQFNGKLILLRVSSDVLGRIENKP